jgi:hypothetical protein
MLTALGLCHRKVPVDGVMIADQNPQAQMRIPMIDEHNIVAVARFDGDAYETSHAAERALNAAIQRAEIARSYEDFLEIFEIFYADDVEASSEDSPVTIRGKEKVRTLLLNFLIPLHVMAEIGGLLIATRQTASPGDVAAETHSAWTVELVGVSGTACTLKWRVLRRWPGSRVVHEHHYDQQQNGGPLTFNDLSFNAADLAASAGRSA